MDAGTSDFLRIRAPVGRENEKLGRASHYGTRLDLAAFVTKTADQYHPTRRANLCRLRTRANGSDRMHGHSTKRANGLEPSTFSLEG